MSGDSPQDLGPLQANVEAECAQKEQYGFSCAGWAAMEARIAELEKENELYSRSPTYDQMAKRIAELEAALKATVTAVAGDRDVSDQIIDNLNSRIAELEEELDPKCPPFNPDAWMP